MNENYWKDAYQGTWDASSKREKQLMTYLEESTGVQCTPFGLGAGSSQYISGSAERNGYQKGDADFVIDGTNIYIEVTGPLSKGVQPDAPLWFRPDKINNAIKNSSHDVFFAHHCMSVNLWRVIHIDEDFKERFRKNQFQVENPVIRGRCEQYVKIKANDKCVHELDYLVKYLREMKGI